MKTEQEIKDEILKTKNINETLKAHYLKYYQVETAIDIANNQAYIEALEYVLNENDKN